MILLLIGMAVGVAIALAGARLAKFGADIPRFGDE